MVITCFLLLLSVTLPTVHAQTATPTPTPTATATATPTPTATSIATATPSATQETLTDAGVSLPTVLGISLGILLLIGALALAL